ncbi:MAG: ribosome-associated translation inhibitor RaiA [Pedobacter sp.]|nr:MAG: ribosome-associated translation inhibitor RaiA [Pedobacter sp.]
MKVRVQSIRFTAGSRLLNFVQKKADKLEQFYDRIIGAEVYMKLENAESESNKITEIKLIIPGNDLFAKEQCKSFEEATDRAVESLRRQIMRHKEKVRVQMSNHKLNMRLGELRAI